MDAIPTIWGPVAPEGSETMAEERFETMPAGVGVGPTARAELQLIALGSDGALILRFGFGDSTYAQISIPFSDALELNVMLSEMIAKYRALVN